MSTHRRRPARNAGAVLVVMAITAVLTTGAGLPDTASPAGTAWTKSLPQSLLGLSGPVARAAGLPQLFPVSTGGATITVGPGGPPTFDHETIQGAIDAASSGDTIRVAAATYHENLVWEDKDLRLISEVAGEAVVDGGGAASCLRMHNVPDTSRVEGFTFTNGHATGAPPDTAGGGIYLEASSPTILGNNIVLNEADSGGGIYCSGGAPTIIDNTINMNHATGGGGIEARESDAVIIGNRIQANRSLTNGGGILCRDGAPAISGNIISMNRAYTGGGVLLYQSAATVTGNIISNNRAEPHDGGGIYIQACSPTITNNTISGNRADGFGGGMLISHPTASPVISNTIVTFSVSGVGIHVQSGTATVSYSNVFGNADGNYVGIPDPTGAEGNISLDPLFANPALGDLHLRSVAGRWDPEAELWVFDPIHSPCVDAGDPASDYSNAPFPHGGRVNIGAYGNTPEASKSAALGEVWVDDDFTTATPGWGITHFAAIQEGIDAIGNGGRVYVAAGTYVENLAWDTRCIQLLGAGAGLSIVDGNATASCLRMTAVPATSRVKGFTFTNGRATGSDLADRSGGGIYLESSSPTIINNAIEGNTADRSGGGIYCDESHPYIIGNVISGNTAVALRGGGIHVGNSSPTIVNNTIALNTADNGAGIYITGSASAPEITNTIVAFSITGCGIRRHYGTPTITYCNVYGNMGGEYSGMGDPTGSAGNISEDPLFAQTAEGDFHLRSTGGRWDGVQWVQDAVHSPCIDAGDPAMSVGDESAPHGDRINMGAFGGTQFASMSAPAPTVVAVVPDSGENDGQVDVTITGSGFLTNAVAKLMRSGQPDIDGTSVVVESDTEITCSFELTGAEVGPWNVVVTNIDGQSSQLDDGFNVLAPHEITITDDPAGDPNPATTGGKVQCSVTAQCSGGHDLSYAWSAEGGAGSFDDANTVSPTWTAPATAGDYEITVIVTCAEDASVSATASYTQQVVPGVAHTFPAGIQMVSVPVVPDDADPAQLGFDDGKWARWDPAIGEYRTHPHAFTSFDPAASVPGKGYWARFAAAAEVNVAGEPVSGDAYAMQLPAGWSQIGNPRLTALPWSILGDGALIVRKDGVEKTLADARAAGWCEDFAWAYRQGAGYELVYDRSVLAVGEYDRLNPWEGYWFLAHEPLELVFPSIAEVASAAVLPAAERAEGDWSIPFIASLDGGSSAQVVVGKSATPRQMQLPPSFSSSVQLTVLRDSQRLGVDLQEQGEGPVWTLQAVSSVADAQVNLQWPDLSELPHDYRPMLVDTATGKRTYMCTSQGYSFTTGEVGEARRFEVQMAPAGVGALVTTATASTTGGGNVEVRVTVSAAATVDAEVMNIAGRQVATVCRDREMEAGAEVLLWDAMSDRGTRLPGGIYLIRVTARTEDGQQTSALAPLQLGR